MAIKPPPITDVIRQVNELIGESGIRGEVDKGMRALVQSAMSRLDMVSREEFDTQAEQLVRMRERVEELERMLEALAEDDSAA